MSLAEKRQLHGTIDARGRMGPVTVTIKPEFEHLLAASAEETKARTAESVAMVSPDA